MKKSKSQQDASILESSDIFKKIFEITPDAIIVLNTKGKIIHTNERVFEWMGYKRDEIIGQTIATLPFMSKKTKLMIAKKFASRIVGKKVPPYLMEMIAKDKSIRLAEIRGTPIKNDEGKIIGDLVIATDKTDLELTKDEAETTTSRINAILASMEDMVLVIDENNNLIFHNSTSFSSSSFDPAKYVGKNVMETFPQSIAQAFKSCFEQNKDGKTCEFEYTVTESSGMKKWFSSKMSPIIIDDEFSGCVSVVRDITAIKNSEIILKEKNEELQKLNDLMIGREAKMAELKAELGKLKNLLQIN